MVVVMSQGGSIAPPAPAAATRRTPPPTRRCRPPWLPALPCCRRLTKRRRTPCPTTRSSPRWIGGAGKCWLKTLASWKPQTRLYSGKCRRCPEEPPAPSAGMPPAASAAGQWAGGRCRCTEPVCSSCPTRPCPHGCCFSCSWHQYRCARSHPRPLSRSSFCHCGAAARPPDPPPSLPPPPPPPPPLPPCHHLPAVHARRSRLRWRPTAPTCGATE